MARFLYSMLCEDTFMIWYVLIATLIVLFCFALVKAGDL